MSKATLKKALVLLTTEQKDELILDLYSARAEAKEYLEFFVDPDIDKLIEKTMVSITKEINHKGKYGYLKPRIAKIKALIKKVATLRPGAEYVISLKIKTLAAAAEATDGHHFFTDAHENSFARILIEAIIEANMAGILTQTIANIQEMIDRIPFGRSIRTTYKDALKSVITNISTDRLT